MDNDIAIKTENLRKIYRGFAGKGSVTALKGLNLEVKKGEVFGLLGPNGSGKTTTVKLLLGLLFPTRGKAWVLGRPTSDVSVKSRIGFLPEESYLYRFLNAEETLDFYGRLFEIPKEERKKRTNRLIGQVGLDHARRRPLKEYSKGMSRRIGFAQALINEPELVFLDEPTSGMDPIGTREMKDLILGLKEQGSTVLMCSHLLADVEDVCDRIAILDEGELQEIGPVKDLISQKDTVQILASPAEKLPQETIEQIKSLISQCGATTKIDNPTTTLEELFLKVIKRYKPSKGEEADAKKTTADKK